MWWLDRQCVKLHILNSHVRAPYYMGALPLNRKLFCLEVKVHFEECIKNVWGCGIEPIILIFLELQKPYLSHKDSVKNLRGKITLHNLVPLLIGTDECCHILKILFQYSKWIFWAIFGTVLAWNCADAVGCLLNIFIAMFMKLSLVFSFTKKFPWCFYCAHGSGLGEFQVLAGKSQTLIDILGVGLHDS